MAKILEVVGISGAGKTDLYEALSRHWKTGKHWIPAHMIYPQRTRTLNPVKKLMYAVLDKNQTLDEKAMRKAASRFIALHPDYMENCWSHIMRNEKKSLNMTDQRFSKEGHVFRVIQKVQICR